MQDCGGCKHFQKRKNFDGSSGLCELHDRRTDEDLGHACHDFRRPKYNRNESKKKHE